MDAEATIEIPDHVMIREVGGEAVLLDLETEKYFGLDDVGAAILRHLSGGDTLAEAARKITEEYDAPVETVVADAIALVQTLVERGLVRRTVDKR